MFPSWMEISFLSDTSVSSSNYSTDDEADPQLEPTIFVHAPDPDGQPVLDVDTSVSSKPSVFPLCLVFNTRSLYNKAVNFKQLLHQFTPDVALVSETFERDGFPLSNLLNINLYEVHSSNRSTTSGGGCAIFYKKINFLLQNLKWMYLKKLKLSGS